VDSDEGQVLLLWVRQLPTFDDLKDLVENFNDLEDDDEEGDDFDEDDDDFDDDDSGEFGYLN
jgi:hypothetical protein